MLLPSRPCSYACWIARSVRLIGPSCPWRMNTKPFVAPVAYPAMHMPSSRVYGSLSRMPLSLYAPGSPSSQLHRMYFGGSERVMKLHFTPVGNAAPPLPRSPESMTSLMTSSGCISNSALYSPEKPPLAMYCITSSGAVLPALRRAIFCCIFMPGSLLRSSAPSTCTLPR